MCSISPIYLIRHDFSPLASVSGNCTFLGASACWRWLRLSGTFPIELIERCPPKSPMCLLFAWIHCHLDPSNGAALCTRELLEPLAALGSDCRVLTTGILDPEQGHPTTIRGAAGPRLRGSARSRRIHGLDLCRQVAPGHTFPLSVPVDGTWPDLLINRTRKERQPTPDVVLRPRKAVWRL